VLASTCAAAEHQSIKTERQSLKARGEETSALGFIMSKVNGIRSDSHSSIQFCMLLNSMQYSRTIHWRYCDYRFIFQSYHVYPHTKDQNYSSC